MLLWLVTGAALLAAALAWELLGGFGDRAAHGDRFDESAGCRLRDVGFLLAAEQLCSPSLAGRRLRAGNVLARLVGEKIFGAAPEPS